MGSKRRTTFGQHCKSRKNRIDKHVGSVEPTSVPSKAQVKRARGTKRRTVEDESQAALLPAGRVYDSTGDSPSEVAPTNHFYEDVVALAMPRSRKRVAAGRRNQQAIQLTKLRRLQESTGQHDVDSEASGPFATGAILHEGETNVMEGVSAASSPLSNISSPPLSELSEEPEADDTQNTTVDSSLLSSIGEPEPTPLDVETGGKAPTTKTGPTKSKKTTRAPGTSEKRKFDEILRVMKKHRWTFKKLLDYVFVGQANIEYGSRYAKGVTDFFDEEYLPSILEKQAERGAKHAKRVAELFDQQGVMRHVARYLPDRQWRKGCVNIPGRPHVCCYFDNQSLKRKREEATLVNQPAKVPGNAHTEEDSGRRPPPLGSTTHEPPSRPGQPDNSLTTSVDLEDTVPAPSTNGPGSGPLNGGEEADDDDDDEDEEFYEEGCQHCVDLARSRGEELTSKPQFWAIHCCRKPTEDCYQGRCPRVKRCCSLCGGEKHQAPNCPARRDRLAEASFDEANVSSAGPNIVVESHAGVV